MRGYCNSYNDCKKDANFMKNKYSKQTNIKNIKDFGDS